MNDAGDIPTKRLLHHVAKSMGGISFQRIFFIETPKSKAIGALLIGYER